MQPDPTQLLEIAGIDIPLIGVYDAANTAPFEPLIAPKEGKWACVFMYYPRWLKGETLHLTPDNFGCRGAGTMMLDQKTRTRKEYIDFLCDDEGLKADKETMGRWIDKTRHYRPEKGHLFVGPLKPDQYDALKTVTFFVNPDQLTLLLTGAHYKHATGDPSPVAAPFGSGCGLLTALFENLDTPRAMIGGTDIAMRRFLPPDILAFTVTKPMFAQLAGLDEHSFLHKPFWQKLKAARKRRSHSE